ncbi:MAG: hypothetical protein IT379_26110 [Deltaproteobacteria bacterium]|nr:hypothetical protein [Deltaproteobacteria bacterium]
MDEPSKLQRLGRVLAMVVNTIEREKLRPPAIVALKAFVEAGHVELRGRTRGGKVGVLVRFDESASEDPEHHLTAIVEAMTALAAKDPPDPTSP